MNFALNFETYIAGDFEQTWQEHCHNETLLSEYADAMHHLATDHWSKKPETRIDWCRHVCHQYFFEVRFPTTDPMSFLWGYPSSWSQVSSQGYPGDLFQVPSRGTPGAGGTLPGQDWGTPTLMPLPPPGQVALGHVTLRAVRLLRFQDFLV